MKTKILLSWALVACLIISCSDDDDPYTCSTCVDTPEAAAANNASGKGIYKGLVVGSSGTIKFNIANSGTTLTAVLVLDGETFELETEDEYGENGFEGYFYNDAEGIEIGFYVSGNGEASGVFGIVIPGHPDVTIEIVKELSTKLVRVFEGTYSGDSNGTLNMITQDDEWGIVAKGPDGEDAGELFGTLSNNDLACLNCFDVEITGRISGDNVSGSWESSDESGSWKGRRTL